MAVQTTASASYPYRCTWTFGMAGDGWTEEWFLPAASAPAALSVCKAVTPARLNLCVNLVNVDQIKVSDESIRGDSLPDYSMSGLQSKITANLSRNVKTASLLCRAFSTPQSAPDGSTFQYQRGVELSGMPINWIDYNNQGNPIVPPNADPQLNAQFNAWVTKMAASGFCLRVNNKATVFSPVLDIGVNPNTLVAGVSQGNIMLYCPNHGLAGTNNQGNATTFRVKGAKFLSTYSDPLGKGPLDQRQHSIINRVHQFQTITPSATGTLPIVNGKQTTATDWLQLNWYLPTGFGLLVYEGGGNVQARLWFYAPLGAITDPTTGQSFGPIIAERWNSRSRGRRRFTQRGRSSKRVITAGIR